MKVFWPVSIFQGLGLGVIFDNDLDYLTVYMPQQDMSLWARLQLPLLYLLV